VAQESKIENIGEGKFLFHNRFMNILLIILIVVVLVPFFVPSLNAQHHQHELQQSALADSNIVSSETDIRSEKENDALKATPPDLIFDVFETWVDAQVDTGNSFLEQFIYNQPADNAQQITTDPFDNLFGHKESTSNDGPSLLSMAQNVMTIASGDPMDSHSSLDKLLFTAREVIMNRAPRKRTLQEQWELFTNNIQQVMSQLKESLDHISFDQFNPLGLYYFVEQEDERITPSWKRKQHRYHKSLEVNTLQELHNALFLSQLAYAKTSVDIQDGLKTFLNNSYVLIYSNTKGVPGEPAHFLAMKKESNPLIPFFPWQIKSHDLEILLVVRGTKELGDAVPDGLLAPDDFRTGKVHGGIGKAGKFLVTQHIHTLQHLLNVSKRDSIRLTMMGHSLGAGAAAIAAMEFNDYYWISVKSIGFGCPALLNLELSESTKSYITTVISDADIVPRMSGASLANLILDVMSYDWTTKALEDVEQFLDFLNGTVPFEIPKASILTWVQKGMETNDKPKFDQVQKDRLPIVLYPPGTCIHMFRDGSGFTATYTPCAFFNRVEYSRTLVDDHLIPPGYHKAMLGMLRDARDNLNDDFEHDLIAIPV
jgi:Lipase (class 3)